MVSNKFAAGIYKNQLIPKKSNGYFDGNNVSGQKNATFDVDSKIRPAEVAARKEVMESLNPGFYDRYKPNPGYTDTNTTIVGSRKDMKRGWRYARRKEEKLEQEEIEQAPWFRAFRAENPVSKVSFNSIYELETVV